MAEVGTALERLSLTQEACFQHSHLHRPPGLGADGPFVLSPRLSDITGHFQLVTLSLKKNNSHVLISSSDLIDLNYCQGLFEISATKDQIY